MPQVVAFGNKIPYWYHQVQLEGGMGLIVDGRQYDDDTFDLYMLYQPAPEPGTQAPGKLGWAWMPGLSLAEVDSLLTIEQPFLALESS